MTKTTTDPYRSTYHRDGTVTIWSVHQQRRLRVRASDISAETLASLSETERQRIARVATAAGVTP